MHLSRQRFPSKFGFRVSRHLDGRTVALAERMQLQKRTFHSCSFIKKGNFRVSRQRESPLLTTYWTESTLSSRWFGRSASRHGPLDSFFQVALYLPFYSRRHLKDAPLKARKGRNLHVAFKTCLFTRRFCTCHERGLVRNPYDCGGS